MKKRIMEMDCIICGLLCIVLVFAALFLAEKITLPKMAGVALITAGAIIIAIS